MISFKRLSYVRTLEYTNYNLLQLFVTPDISPLLRSTNLDPRDEHR